MFGQNKQYANELASLISNTYSIREPYPLHSNTRIQK